MGRKMIGVLLEEEFIEQLKAKAEQNGDSLSTYAGKLILSADESLVIKKKSIEELVEFDENEEINEADKTCWIVLRDEDAVLLKRKAQAMNLSPTAYVRNMARTKNFKILEFPKTDLDEFRTKIIGEAHAVEVFVGLIKYKGGGEVFKQDIKTINDKLDYITGLIKDLMNYWITERKRICRDVTKKLMIQIEEPLIEETKKVEEKTDTTERTE